MQNNVAISLQTFEGRYGSLVERLLILLSERVVKMAMRERNCDVAYQKEQNAWLNGIKNIFGKLSSLEQTRCTQQKLSYCLRPLLTHFQIDLEVLKPAKRPSTQGGRRRDRAMNLSQYNDITDARKNRKSVTLLWAEDEFGKEPLHNASPTMKYSSINIYNTHNVTNEMKTPIKSNIFRLCQ